ncbi:MAG: DUF4476 domain-containing protein [Flavobacteriales bacterium]|nr:DUF4476 domain-containing protein [Flavobacteriales bacterium]
MKSAIIILVQLVTASIFCFAQGSSNLEVYSENGERFYLILNGVRQNENPETNILVQGLTNEYYHTKVIFEDQSLGEIERRNLGVIDASGNRGQVSYVVRYTKKGEYKLRYYNFVQNPPTPPATVSVVRYNTVPMPPISTSITVSETTTTTTAGVNDNVNANVNMGGVNFGMNININDGFGGSSTTTTSSTTVTTTEVRSAPPTHEVVPVGCANQYCMSETDFNQAMNSLQSKSFADTKLSMANQIINNNCLRSSQVMRMLQVFDFEDNKLQVAKTAYTKTTDPNKYYMVNDAFDFESSVEELNNYISSVRF